MVQQLVRGTTTGSFTLIAADWPPLFMTEDNLWSNKRRGAPRDGEGRCAGCDASEGYVSDVEVRLHDMHVHDQVFITKNDEHFEEISMKQ